MPYANTWAWSARDMGGALPYGSPSPRSITTGVSSYLPADGEFGKITTSNNQITGNTWIVTTSSTTEVSHITSGPVGAGTFVWNYSRSGGTTTVSLASSNITAPFSYDYIIPKVDVDGITIVRGYSVSGGHSYLYYVDIGGQPYSPVSDPNPYPGSNVSAIDGQGMDFNINITTTLYYVGNAGSSAGWNNSSYWSDTSGGSGGIGIPTSAIDVIFDSNSPLCTLDVNAACKSLSVNSANGISGNTFNLTVEGSVVHSHGLLSPSSGTFTFNNSVAGTSSFTDSAFVFGVPYSGLVYFRKTTLLTFNGTSPCVFHRIKLADSGTTIAMTGSPLWFSSYLEFAGGTINAIQFKFVLNTSTMSFVSGSGTTFTNGTEIFTDFIAGTQASTITLSGDWTTDTGNMLFDLTQCHPGTVLNLTSNTNAKSMSLTHTRVNTSGYNLHLYDSSTSLTLNGSGTNTPSIDTTGGGTVTTEGNVVLAGGGYLYAQQGSGIWLIKGALNIRDTYNTSGGWIGGSGSLTVNGNLYVGSSSSSSGELRFGSGTVEVFGNFTVASASSGAPSKIVGFNSEHLIVHGDSSIVYANVAEGSNGVWECYGAMVMGGLSYTRDSTHVIRLKAATSKNLQVVLWDPGPIEIQGTIVYIGDSYTISELRVTSGSLTLGAMLNIKVSATFSGGTVVGSLSSSPLIGITLIPGSGTLTASAGVLSSNVRIFIGSSGQVDIRGNTINRLELPIFGTVSNIKGGSSFTDAPKILGTGSYLGVASGSTLAIQSGTYIECQTLQMSSGSNIEATSSTPFFLKVDDISPSVPNVYVRNANASAGSTISALTATNGGGNTNWLFPAPTTTSTSTSTSSTSTSSSSTTSSSTSTSSTSTSSSSTTSSSTSSSSTSTSSSSTTSTSTSSSSSSTSTSFSTSITTTTTTTMLSTTSSTSTTGDYYIVEIHKSIKSVTSFIGGK